MLGLYGGADEGIPPDQVDAFERNLAEAGVEYEIVTYPGAPHSFFDRRYEEHAEACADAWRRVLGFLALAALLASIALLRASPDSRSTPGPPDTTSSPSPPDSSSSPSSP